MRDINIFLCGVGGQGIILASEILTEVAMRSGYDVKKSEVHGMAQRGGSVTSEVRFGKKVYSPLIPKKETDYLIALEYMEVLRYLGNLSGRTTVLASTQKIVPTSVIFGDIKYPDNVESLIEGKTKANFFMDVVKIAKELGNIRVVNIIFLGALSKLIGDIPLENWTNTIKDMVKPKFIDINLKAFERGRELV